MKTRVFLFSFFFLIKRSRNNAKDAVKRTGSCFFKKPWTRESVFHWFHWPLKQGGGVRFQLKSIAVLLCGVVGDWALRQSRLCCYNGDHSHCRSLPSVHTGPLMPLWALSSWDWQVATHFKSTEPVCLRETSVYIKRHLLNALESSWSKQNCQLCTARGGLKEMGTLPNGLGISDSAQLETIQQK